MNFSIKPSSTTISLFFFLSIFLFHQSSIAQQPAFPSAYGAGAYTEGGRGGKIVHVTNLNDSGSGSLRWALTDRSNKGVKRTIVFDVSGVINLQEWIYMSNSPGDEGGYADGITIAGQTAPEGGITITGDRLRLSSINNVVVRYLKFRESPSGLGGLTILQSNDVVIDHLSASHGNSISIVMAASKTSNIDNNTLQNCLMGQSKNGVLAGNSEFANGAVSLPYGGISILRNAYYNVGWRIPGKFGGQAEVDVVNNIAHNWQGRLMRFDPYNYSLNHIGNYYQSGLTTLNSGSSVLHKTWTNSTMAPKIYNYDNFVSPDVKPVGYDTDESTAWAPFTAASVEPVKAEWFVNFQLPMQGRPVPVLLSSQLKQEILPHVGASKYLNGDGTVGFYRDSLDLAFVHGINIRDMTLRSQNGQVPTGMPSETRPSNFYNLSKNEHIPEVWFDANVPAGQDHNDIAPSGYTWLEEYLNQVDGPSVIVAAQSVEVTPGKTELQISKILQLAKTFTPANAANQNGTWTSSDEDIAKVDANGLVTAIAVGEVTITFTATEGGHKGKSEITVFPEALQASAGTDQNICQGSSTTLTATGGSTYLWSTGEKTEEITVSPTATTTYTVTAYDSTGKNSDTDDVKVTVNPLPTVDAGNSVTINSGESTTLTATGATSYEWSTGATSASITVTPTATKTYTVTGTTNGCEATDTVKVTVSNSETVVADAGGERNLCAGSSTTLTATGGATYLWSTGEKTAKITVSPTVTTIFTVTAYDSTGKNSDKADVKINVNPLPTVDAGNSVTINSGESTTLTATGATSYEWSTGATSASITVTPTATNTYTVTGTTKGCEATDTVKVTVRNSVEVVAAAGADQNICQGSSTSLTASGGATYLWNTGETTASISVSPTATTTYTVTAYDSTGKNSDTDDVKVTVNPLPTVDAGNSVTINSGESTTLTATGATSYEWSTGATTASITVTPTATKTYTVTGTTKGCEATDTVKVTVRNSVEVVAAAGADQNICQGSSTTLTATGGSTYLWSTGETTESISVAPSATTTYTLTAYDSTGTNSDTDDVKVTVNPLPTVDAGNSVTINSGESTTLTATGATSYEWSTGATSASITVTPTATKTYTVTGTTNGCEATDTVKVTVSNSETVVADAGGERNLCAGSSTTLTATGGATYLWSTGEKTAKITVSPTVTTIFKVTAYDSTGKNSDKADVKINVNPLPTVDAGNSVTINSGESTTLTAIGAASFKWSTGATTASITVSPTATKTYTVTGTTNGCEATDKVTVTVKTAAKVVANAGSDQNICSGSSTTLTATGGDTYLWNTGAKTESITVNPSSKTSYSVTAFVGKASDTDEVVVYVDAQPNVKIINGSDTTILEGEFITLSASGANTYKWSNGATQPNIAVSPRVTKSYEVTGFVNNCAAQRSIKVNVFEKVVADAGNDVTICSSEKTVLTASGPNNTEYLWNTGETTKSITVDPKVDTEYSVMVYHALDSDTDNVMVKVENCTTPEQITEDSIELTEDATELEFLIHPNPTYGDVNIKVSGLTNLSSIHLYDLSGKSLYNEVINEGDQQSYVKTLNLSDYASGIYLLQLVDNYRVITKKIVLR